MSENEIEFDRQVKNLLIKGYPKLAEITQEAFLKMIAPLKMKVEKLSFPSLDIENGHLPFVIVVKSDLIPAEKTMGVLQRDEKHGITKLFPLTSEDFKTVDSVHIPSSHIYLLLDIDRGKETIHVRPNEALIQIQKENRSPLTIDEGIALITHYPEFLMKNNCFSLLASRHPGDQRVPAIWINAKKHPNLGWCWDGNPHTWLGSASTSQRIGM